MAILPFAPVRARATLRAALFGTLLMAMPYGPAGAVSAIAVTRAFPDLTFSRPVLMLQAPGGSDWYVLEQGGRIIRFADRTDADSVSLFAELRSLVDDRYSESGLLGAAFHPRFAETGEVFLSYTRAGQPLTSVVARFNTTGGGRLDRVSRSEVLEVAQPFRNHNGGHIAFGPDGYLYLGLGDGGSGGDPQGNGQNRNTLLGAILRLDVDAARPYAVPPDNPFVEGGGRSEIFAYGLRNPWRFSFDRATGALWAGDVGQNRVEEIDVIERGGNYGWNLREGSEPFRPGAGVETGLIEPVAEYSHALGCSVTGGAVYRGSALPTLKGVYVFGDFCSGRIWGLDTDSGGRRAVQIAKTDLQIASFAEAHDGRLFVLDLRGGIYQITGAE